MPPPKTKPAAAEAPAAEPPPQPQLPDFPEWVSSTPGDHTYELNMFDISGESLQYIEVTREEFIALKERLAVIRGLVQEEESTNA